MEATKTVALKEAADNRPTPRRDSDAASELTIPALFLAASRARTTRTAIRWKRRGVWNAVGWHEYAAAVREIGCALLAFGLQRGDRVAIISESRPEWLFADLGAQSVGCVAVAVDVSESSERTIEILNDCGARALFVDSMEQLEVVAPALAKTPVLESVVCFDSRLGTIETHVQVIDLVRFRDDGRRFDEKHAGRWEAEIGRARGDDIAVMSYESGSPTRLSHRDLARLLDAVAKDCPGADGDEQLGVLPLSDLQERCFTVYRPLVVGAIVNFAEGSEDLVDGLREVAPHVVMAPPPVWETLHATIAAAIADASPLGRLGYRIALDAKPGSLLMRALVLSRVKTMIGLRRARSLLCNGGPVPPALLPWYRALGLNIIDAGHGEGWRPLGASDRLMNKESR